MKVTKAERRRIGRRIRRGKIICVKNKEAGQAWKELRHHLTTRSSQ